MRIAFTGTSLSILFFLMLEKMERPFLFYHWDRKTPKDSQGRRDSGTGHWTSGSDGTGKMDARD
jgi:hypothetical protein